MRRHSREKRKSGSFGFRFFRFQATSESSFPRRWESRSVRTGTYAPSFPRKRESRFFGTETYRIKRFL
ncbi:hypothetical protein F7O79_11850 [Neisseria meningitidis]|nr:hypothetical protein [Neisseria meningitidis]